MRIVGGEWGGRPLTAPKGSRTRPTSDRVREALFNVLGSVEDGAVLDLFAGTGAVALEALSRGAARAEAVERDRAALHALRANRERLQASNLEIRPEPVERYLERDPHPFDLVFIDPPWADVPAFLDRHGRHLAAWTAPEGWLVVERSRRDGEAPRLEGFEAPRTRRYGDAELVLWARD
ncbi:MAG: 16S rRNA (guanine(966)-N(2))-methyltransferase RsmD, partial [Myxococcota bacterium]